MASGPTDYQILNADFAALASSLQTLYDNAVETQRLLNLALNDIVANYDAAIALGAKVNASYSLMKQTCAEIKTLVNGNTLTY